MINYAYYLFMWNIYVQIYMFIPYFKIYTNVHSLRLMKVCYFANAWIYIYTHIYTNILIYIMTYILRQTYIYARSGHNQDEAKAAHVSEGR